MDRKKQQHLNFHQTPSAGCKLPVLTELACGAFLLTLAGETGSHMPWVGALAGVMVCVCRRILGGRDWFLPAALGVVMVAMVIFREYVADGYALFYNEACMIYTERTGIVIPALAVQNGGISARIVFDALSGASIGLGFCLLSSAGNSVSAVVLALASCSAAAILGSGWMLLPLSLSALMLVIPGKKRALAAPAAVLICALLLSYSTGIHAWALRQSARLHNRFHEQKYETEYTTLPEGNLAAEFSVDSELPALVVTMEKPEELYLRGFTGAVLEGDCWEPLENSILAENQELLYWLNAKEFDLRAQFEAAASAVETQRNTVTVQNIGACSSFRYIPFTVRADDAMIAEDLSSSRNSGERYDVFTTVYRGADLLSQILETLAQSEDASVLRYRRAETAYRGFVQDHFLQIPEDAADQMQMYWDAAAGLDPQSAVRSVLELCFPEGPEYSARYASAAVLTLRYFGIPAQYAEGYIVPESDETTVEVTSRYAACWAEVYHDGIGWIPMALTTGIEGEGNVPQLIAPPPVQPPQESLPEETSPENEPDPSGGYRVTIVMALLGTAGILLLVLVLAMLVLILRRYHVIKKRRLLFEQPEVREAVSWIFADSISILERMGIHRGNGSLDALTEPLSSRFGAEYAEAFAHAAGLNARALFSSREMSEEHRSTVLEFREKTLSLLKENRKGIHKIWMQLVLCLY